MHSFRHLFTKTAAAANSFLYQNFAIPARGKHWNQKYRKFRSQKFLKVKLIDFQELNRSPDELTKEEIRSKLKERGLLPERPWTERPIYISSTGGVFEPYVPPEGDGKISPLAVQGAKQKLEYLEKKSKSMMAVRKIRNFEEEFEYEFFLKEAQDIYVNCHKAMINKNRDLLSQLITERAYPEVVDNIGDKTIYWQFLQSLEPPRIAHVRCTDIITKENVFAQITVRFHTQQVLAVYDRFGRLMHGDESLPKDVLEYVVFEKHLANKYGKWRVHDKIIPNWMPPKEPLRKTYMVDLEVTEPVVESAEKNVTASL